MIHHLVLLDSSELSFKEFLKLIGILTIPILLILIEPNNGTAGVIGLIVVVMCILAHIRFKYWALPLLVLVVIGAISAYHLPYVSARLKVYLHPELDLKGRDINLIKLNLQQVQGSYLDEDLAIACKN